MQGVYYMKYETFCLLYEKLLECNQLSKRQAMSIKAKMCTSY